MGKTKRYMRKAHMKSVSKNLKRIMYGYYAVCSYCGYSGSDWSASGECPSCGEVN